MNYKNKKMMLIVLSLLFIGLGYFLSKMVVFEFETCGTGYSRTHKAINEYGKYEFTPSCSGWRDFFNDIDEYLGVPLFFLSWALFILSIVVLFIKEESFNKWIRFAKIFFPLSLLLVATSPIRGDMIFPSIQSILTFFMPIVFIVSSILVMMLKSKRIGLWIVIAMVVGLIFTIGAVIESMV